MLWLVVRTGATSQLEGALPMTQTSQGPRNDSPRNLHHKAAGIRRAPTVRMPLSTMFSSFLQWFLRSFYISASLSVLPYVHFKLQRSRAVQVELAALTLNNCSSQDRVRLHSRLLMDLLKLLPNPSAGFGHRVQNTRSTMCLFADALTCSQPLARI
jgi:hypothetical protein